MSCEKCGPATYCSECLGAGSCIDCSAWTHTLPGDAYTRDALGFDCSCCGEKICLDCDTPDADERCEQCRQAAIWTDGPDSEAARAYRGEGALREPSSVDYRAAWEGLLSSVSSGTTLREFDAVIGEAGCSFVASFMAGMEAIHARTSAPDPSHTPAARRVVAWVGDDDEPPRLDSFDAYRDAAEVAMYSGRPSAHRMGERVRVLTGRSVLVYWDTVRDRYARLLRHWDEKAGWR